ncbi:A24 family peptidase [Sphingobium nicotianae]|uniref:Prepilin peptidase n=1 Tax=Sphingobium nicotianae TaxID=2782607 RepID=A0A9X1DFV5_9SPHN|nr:A24 family peptidase [Sphingobium nicotianae]MBT2189083.1 prepilin peptidase [Sphingobium nicotianae]
MTWSTTLVSLQVFALASLALAATIDLRTRTIPNELVLCVLVAGLGLRLIDGGLGLLISLAIGAAMLIALTSLARRDHIGGGDAKMIAAVTFLVAPSQVLTLVTAIALAGGILAILYAIGGLASRYAKRRQTAALAPHPSAPSHMPADAPVAAPVTQIAGSDQLPYGIAILAGAALVLSGLP